jgi:hypothetical protein
MGLRLESVGSYLPSTFVGGPPTPAASVRILAARAMQVLPDRVLPGCVGCSRRDADAARARPSGCRVGTHSHAPGALHTARSGPGSGRGQSRRRRASPSSGAWRSSFMCTLFPPTPWPTPQAYTNDIKNEHPTKRINVVRVTHASPCHASDHTCKRSLWTAPRSSASTPPSARACGS